MKNQHLVESAYGTWHSNDVAYIVSIRWNARDFGRLEIDTLVQPRSGQSSWPRKEGQWFEVSLLFSGIRNLKIDGLGVYPFSIAGFDVTDIRTNGWEGISYAIEDYENDSISFYAYDASIVSVVKAVEAPKSIIESAHNLKLSG